MAHRCHRRYQARFDQFQSALLRLSPTSKVQTFPRSGRDTCPNTAQRFATSEALCSGSQESFWFGGIHASVSLQQRRATMLRPNKSEQRRFTERSRGARATLTGRLKVEQAGASESNALQTIAVAARSGDKAWALSSLEDTASSPPRSKPSPQ